MLKRILAVLLSLALCLAALPVLAEESSVTARTSLAGASDAQRSNIALAVEALDGVRIPCGAGFSFNAVVGPRTAAFGYLPAVNGRGATVTGGGVAQAASTLYLALLDLPSGVRFDEFHSYGSRFTGSYVSNSATAVLVDYSAGTDFAFTNLGDDLYIQMWTTDSYVYCTLTLASGTNVQSNSFLDWSGEWTDSRNNGWSGGWYAQRVRIAGAQLPLNGSDNLINNVALAAGSINDTVLPSGAVFSFNDIVGPRGERYGYTAATNGRGVRVIGGGVAQVASVVWLAVKNLDCVSIVEKSTYGKRYNQSYVSSSNDAILTDYGAGTDFSFRNIGAAQLTVCTYIADGVLCCDIYQN